MTEKDDYRGTSADELMSDLVQDEYLAGMYQDTVDRQAVLRSLREVRECSELRQRDVAKSMRVTQSTISELEGEGDDVYLSTVQRYARALGRKIVVVVVGPDEKVQILPASEAAFEDSAHR